MGQALIMLGAHRIGALRISHREVADEMDERAQPGMEI